LSEHVHNGSTRPISPLAKGWRSPRRVVGIILMLSVFLMILGGVYAYRHRHDTICKDKRPPVAQLDLGLGQVQYRCHDGSIVTKP
jgi:hypothetical protein